MSQLYSRRLFKHKRQYQSLSRRTSTSATRTIESEPVSYMRIEHRLIRALDRMDKRIARFPKESEQYKKHAKIREMMCHKFARTLLELEEGEELYDPDPESQYDVGGRIMVPSWK